VTERARRNVIIIAAVLVAVMVAFPPRYMMASTPAGRSFPVEVYYGTIWSSRPDPIVVDRLAIQIIGFLLVGGLIYRASSHESPAEDASQQGHF
jgi:hypothetical protein